MTFENDAVLAIGDRDARSTRGRCDRLVAPPCIGAVVPIECQQLGVGVLDQVRDLDDGIAVTYDKGAAARAQLGVEPA